MTGFDVSDVLVGRADFRVVIRRGLRGRCGRCGGGDLFESHWTLRQRCPTCGYRFRREPGFALGAWFLNFFALGIVFMIATIAYAIWLSGHPGSGLAGPMALGLVLAIVVPLLTTRRSKTTWASVDLVMTPLELDEIVEALDHLGSDRSSLKKTSVDLGPPDPEPLTPESSEVVATDPRQVTNPYEGDGSQNGPQ